MIPKSFRHAGAVIGLIVLGTPMIGAPPPWWATRGVLTPNATASDYAAVNLGQVKQTAKLAVDELEAKLPGGAGPVLTALIASWRQAPPEGVVRNDYPAVNIGQLKALAKPFYDRLAEVGYHGPPLAPGQVYPWTTSVDDDSNYAAANIGQVKRIFSFDLNTLMSDIDSNGLPYAWEMAYFGQTGINPAADPDNDGLSNLQEYLLGRNPIKGATPDTSGTVALRLFLPAR